MQLTVKGVREANPCTDGWKTLLRKTGRAPDCEESILLSEILDKCGLSDTLWGLRASNMSIASVRLLTLKIAELLERLEFVDTIHLEAIKDYREAMASDTFAIVAQKHPEFVELKPNPSIGLGMFHSSPYEAIIKTSTRVLDLSMVPGDYIPAAVKLQESVVRQFFLELENQSSMTV